MKVSVDSIKVNNRIRKEFGDITSLAEDISKNGLISPIAISPDYELLAGERRLRAVKSIGLKEIEANVMSVDDMIGKLMVEISENENRKPFTFSEKMQWAEMLRNEYEKKDGFSDVKKTNDIIAKKVGIGSREKLRRCSFIKQHANESLIKALDENQLSVNAAYVQLKNEKEKLAKANRILEKQESQASKHIDRLDLKVRDLTEKLNATTVSDKDREINRLRKELKKALDDVGVMSKNLSDAEAALDEIKSRTQVCPNHSLIEMLRHIANNIEPLMDIKKSDIVALNTIQRWDLLSEVRRIKQDLQDVEDTVEGVLNEQ